MTGAREDEWITVSEFRTHMSRILREVERGKTFTVVRRGRAVARVVPFVRLRDPLVGVHSATSPRSIVL